MNNDDLIPQLATIYERARTNGAISSGGEAWLIDHLGRVIEALQAHGDIDAVIAELHAEIRQLTRERDAARVTLSSVTTELAQLGARLVQVSRERDAYRAHVPTYVERRLSVQFGHADDLGQRGPR